MSSTQDREIRALAKCLWMKLSIINNQFYETMFSNRKRLKLSSSALKINILLVLPSLITCLVCLYLIMLFTSQSNENNELSLLVNLLMT